MDSALPLPTQATAHSSTQALRAQGGASGDEEEQPHTPRLLQPQPQQRRGSEPEAASRGVQPSASVMVITHSHAHAQWRTIAEEFSSLLSPDFVDVVFKVRGRPSLLAAHRSLVAAAWPVLRDSLRRLSKPPPREFREAGLQWTCTEGEPRPLGSPGGPASERQPHESPLGSPSRFEADVPSRNRRERPSNSSSVRSQSPDREMSLSGVLDVSSQMWGSASLLRALLCHLYSRPVTIADRELPSLRVAALHLGSTELARCCDDADRRPLNRATPKDLVAPPTRPSTPEPDGMPGQYTQERASASCSSTAPPREAASILSGSASTSAASISVQLPEETGSSSCSVSRDASLLGVGKQVASGPGRVNAINLPMGGQVPPSAEASPRWQGLSPGSGPGGTSGANQDGSDARLLRSAAAAAKAWGERGQHPDNKAVDKQSGGVRRVLSEIKRTMVESSRIIADKTFQQMYEMVPGERGILGEGINGPVRMARHRKTGREVAVKRISCMNLSDQRRQMLVSEVRIFLQVSHRNIVQLLEVYESGVDQAVLLVMELCTGKELFERLAERRWYSEFDAARVAKQMLDAVSYLHSQNICHRDLKLENWLYENSTQEAKLKLCDFGFGQIVEPSVQLTATLGSLFYVAPEVLEGSYGLPCDMWSVGVIVYMLLSGVPPFDGKTDADVMAKIRQGRFVSTGKRWEGISETAKHFVRSMLRKDPYERLTAAEAAQHAWLKMECQVKPYSWPKGGPDAELELPIDRGVIRDMWKFAQNNAITRAALGMLAKLNTSSFGGREEDVVVLEQRFRSHDEQNTGKIDAEAFIQVLKETLHLQVSSAEEKQFFKRIAESLPLSEDSGNNVGIELKKRRHREVNYGAFITLTKARRMANNTAAIREAFKLMDIAGDGYIKEDDMHSLFGDDVKSTIEQYVDVKGKDFIDYNHFASIVSQEIAKKDKGPAEQSAPAAAAEADQPPPPERSISGTPGEPDDPGQRPQPEAPPPVSIAAPPVTPSAPLKIDVTEAKQLSRQASTDPPTPTLPQPAASAGEKPADPKEEAAQQQAQPDVAKEPTGESDEERDEECDADAASDEEQLVNVVKKDSAPAKPPEENEAENPQPPVKKAQPPPKDKTSFSLSLAGSSEYDDVGCFGINRVISMPSDVYSIRQLPGFHTGTLRPFYAARPVSNVVMGLIRGTSLYAKQSVAARLATIIHTTCGWFFIMPNPKYHTEVDTRNRLISKENGKFRFVAWWIHPRFVPQLRQWFERCFPYEGLDQEFQEQRREARAQQLKPSQEPPPLARATTVSGAEEVLSVTSPVVSEPKPVGAAPVAATEPPVTGEAPKLPKTTSTPMEGGEAADHAGAAGVGSPGDFRFSDVPKPDNYLHTYRDLHTREHVNMLTQLNDGTHRFLRTLFDENFMAHAHISAGFHYPVRTQYATLHMQLRVNSGSVCREDGRGIEVETLIETLKHDRKAYERDAETLRYHVTENVKVSLLAAAEEKEEKNPGESAKRHLSPLAFELGVPAMPTIHDEGEEEEDVESGNRAARGAATTASAAAAAAAAGGDAAGEVEEPEAMVVCPGSAPAPEEAEDEAPASYLVNLQPSPGSKFWKVIYHRREECASAFGADPSYLYPLHISVTGFFEAYQKQVDALVVAMNELLQKELDSAMKVSVGKVICTKTGYVLFDMQADAITSFAQRLGERSSRELGVHIRPKAVNHISLACNRPEEEVREKIKAIYEPDPTEPGGLEAAEAYATASFDLVLSRLLARSSFERMAEDGPHRFAEIARLPVSRN